MTLEPLVRVRLEVPRVVRFVCSSLTVVVLVNHRVEVAGCVHGPDESGARREAVPCAVTVRPREAERVEAVGVFPEFMPKRGDTQDRSRRDFVAEVHLPAP